VRGESKDADVEIEMSLEPPALLELRQCHDYIRHVTGLYIVWFTFFLTTVLAAIAWSFVSSLDKDGHLAVPELLYGVVAFFEIQLVLAILGTNVVFTALKKQEARAQHLLAHFAKQFPMDGYTPESPVQGGIPNAFKVMRATLVVNVITWLLVAVLAAYAHSHKIAVAGTLGHS